VLELRLVPFNETDALDLIAAQPETALKLEEHYYSTPKYGLLGRASGAAALVALVLVAVALALAQVPGGPPFDVTAPAVVFGSIGFLLSRLVTDLIEENKRDAVGKQLGDLVHAVGKLTPKGKEVIDQLKLARSVRPIVVSADTTPIEALIAAAETARQQLAAKQAQQQTALAPPRPRD
jgi:hypothetical protein